MLRKPHPTSCSCVHRIPPNTSTYRQMSYAEALNKTGNPSVEATIRQWRLLFTRELSTQHNGRLPKRLAFGKLVGEENSGVGRPAQHWFQRLEGNFKVFGATYGSKEITQLAVGINCSVWTSAARRGQKGCLGTAGFCWARRGSWLLAHGSRGRQQTTRGVHTAVETNTAVHTNTPKQTRAIDNSYTYILYREF